MSFDKECRAAIVPKRDFAGFCYFYVKTTAYNEYLFIFYALVMHKLKIRPKIILAREILFNYEKLQDF